MKTIRVFAEEQNKELRESFQSLSVFIEILFFPSEIQILYA